MKVIDFSAYKKQKPSAVLQLSLIAWLCFYVAATSLFFAFEVIVVLPITLARVLLMTLTTRFLGAAK